MTVNHFETYKRTLFNIQHLITEHKELHVRQYTKLNHCYNILIIASICITPLAALFSTIGTILHPEDHKVLPLMSAGTSFVSSIILSIVKHLHIEKHSKDHHKLVTEYNSLYLKIDKKLTCIDLKRLMSKSKSTLKQCMTNITLYYRCMWMAETMENN